MPQNFVAKHLFVNAHWQPPKHFLVDDWFSNNSKGAQLHVEVYLLLEEVYKCCKKII